MPRPPHAAEPPTPMRRIELQASGDLSIDRKSVSSVLAVVRAQLSTAMVSRSITREPCAIISMVFRLDWGAVV